MEGSPFGVVPKENQCLTRKKLRFQFETDSHKRPVGLDPQQSLFEDLGLDPFAVSWQE